MVSSPAPPLPLRQSRILRLWWPLAASWLLMGVEMPLFAAVVARFPDPEVHLAAHGSLVFPLALVIEAPIIMLLAASTVLCTDWISYRKLYRFMMVAGAALTAVHLAVAFTPLYYVVARDLIGVPTEVVEPARWGLQIMTPWTWAIAHRRFNQGILIRFERSRIVGLGTVVRLVANAGVLTLGSIHRGFPGIVVGTAGIAAGVIAEAVFIAWFVRPVVRERLAGVQPAGEPLTRRAFLHFYVPLALTPLLTLLVQPLSAMAMSRMPRSLSSLAAWPAVYGLVFMLRSLGFAFNEVVVTLLGEPGAERALRRFATGLALATSGVLLALGVTPLAELWFRSVSGLPPELAGLCRTAVLLAVLMPGYAALQSWYQGALVHSKRTRGITEGVALYLHVAGAGLIVGALWDAYTGIHFTLVTLSTAGVAQTLWLAWRRRALRRAGPAG